MNIPYAAFTELYKVAKDPTQLSWTTVLAAKEVGEFLGKSAVDILRAMRLMKASPMTLDEAAAVFAASGAKLHTTEIDMDQLAEAYDCVCQPIFNP